MSEYERIQLEHGYVLHQRSYRNSSQLLDCLTQRHGLVALVARGSRRVGSGQRAILQPFIPLRISWTRRGELGRLVNAELAWSLRPLTGDALLAGYYLNELLLRLMAKGDPNAEIYDDYRHALAQLGSNAVVSRVLRVFELRLLRALGYGLELDFDIETGSPIRPDLWYQFTPERGACVNVTGDRKENVFSGRDLIELREERLADAESLQAARRLLKPMLSRYLGERPLKSSIVMREIVGRGLKPRSGPTAESSDPLELGSVEEGRS